jgi:hypothetical protein
MMRCLIYSILAGNWFELNIILISGQVRLTSGAGQLLIPVANICWPSEVNLSEPFARYTLISGFTGQNPSLASGRTNPVMKTT